MADYRKGLHLIPARMHGGIERYLEYGVIPGSFLTAIFSHSSWVNVMSLADGENRELLPQYAEFLFNYVPANAHGAPERVEAWARDSELSRTNYVSYLRYLDEGEKAG